MKPARLFIGAGALLVAAASIAAGPAASARSTATTARAAPSSKHVAIKCEYSRLCPDVADPTKVFDEYVGHDEPSAAVLLEQAGLGKPQPVPGDPAARSVAGATRRPTASRYTSS